MAEPRRRRKGTAKDTVGIYVRVDEDVRDRIAELSQSLNVAKAVVIQELVRRVDVDAHGRPTWWPEVYDEQEELPLKTA